MGWPSVASLMFSSGLVGSASSSSLKLNSSLFREMVIGAKFKCLWRENDNAILDDAKQFNF